MRVTCTRVLEFDAAHRVLRHESKCATLHGHRYKVELEVSAEQLDSVGRVVDFGVVKQVVGKWIDDNLDHTTLVNGQDFSLLAFCEADHALGKRAPFVMTSEPTAENIALVICYEARRLLQKHLTVERVRVYETPNCFAEVVDWRSRCTR